MNYEHILTKLESFSYIFPLESLVQPKARSYHVDPEVKQN